MTERLWPPSHLEHSALFPKAVEMAYTGDGDVRMLDDPPYGDAGRFCGVFWLSHRCLLALGHDGDHECWMEDLDHLQRWLLCCSEPADSQRLFT